MKTIDYIRQMNDEKLAEFILNFDMDIVSSIMCQKHCPHRKVDEKGVSHCEKDEEEDCLYSDEEMVKDWLNLEMEQRREE